MDKQEAAEWFVSNCMPEHHKHIINLSARKRDAFVDSFRASLQALTQPELTALLKQRISSTSPYKSTATTVEFGLAEGELRAGISGDMLYVDLKQRGTGGYSVTDPYYDVVSAVSINAMSAYRRIPHKDYLEKIPTLATYYAHGISVELSEQNPAANGWQYATHHIDKYSTFSLAYENNSKGLFFHLSKQAITKLVPTNTTLNRAKFMQFLEEAFDTVRWKFSDMDIEDCKQRFGIDITQLPDMKV